jgi:hypothetical protein
VLRAALLVILVACSTPPDGPSGPQPPVSTQRAITPRSKLPPAIATLLPMHGVYMAGGGLVSTPWRVVVDYDNKTIYGGTSKAANGPSYGAMDKEATRELSPRNEVHLIKLAEDAWRETPPKGPVDPTADYDEILVVLDGDDAFYLQGFGPIRRPLAAKAIIEFRAAAGL